MNTHDTARSPWWIFFPVRGIELNSVSHDIAKPIFQDATILSKKHVRQIVSKLKYNQEISNGHDHERDIVFMLENMAFSEEFHSYIAVQRSGPADTLTGMENNILTNAKERAYQVAATLALVMLANNRRARTLGLIEQIHQQTQTSVMLNLENKGFQFQSAYKITFTVANKGEKLLISRRELKAMLSKEPCRSLVEATLYRDRKIARSFRQSLSQAVVRLSDALHSTSLSTQLLGMVTAIEILIGGDASEKYDVIKERLIALLGLPFTQDQNINGIFHARHLYVHQGISVTDLALPYKALILTMSCVFRVASICTSFSDKPTFLKYLDVIYSASQLQQGIPEKTKAMTGRLVSHERDGYTFPFMSTAKDAG